MRTSFLWLIGICACVPVLGGPDASLASGMLQISPPDEPWELTSIADGGTGAFFTLPRKAGMLVSFVGNKAPKTPEKAAAQKKDILAELLANFRRKDLKMLIEPREEADARFFLVVHERWKKDEQTLGQWHVYQNLGPHQVVIVILGGEATEEEAKAMLTAATEMAQSAKLVPPGTKAPPPLAMKKKPAAPEASPELAAAAKALDEATAKCVAGLEQQPAYRAAARRVEELDARLRELRAQEPVDREKVADVARERLDAKSLLDGQRRAALDKDAAVMEARKKLAEVKAGGVR
ncbi:MAG: hypothetical protein ACHRHE_12845 [Tepidisphaerales bacterium]